MRIRFCGAALALVCAGAAAPAFAQGSFFTSLSGTVSDPSGGVLPGATVRIANNGTGEEFNAVTGSDGGFSVPSLPGGIYSVTVSLMGFKTSILNAVTLNAAVPASVKVTLQVGALEESVTVVGDSALVIQTQTPSISTNLSSQQITSLPLTTRNALDSLTSLPGFNTSGTARNSTINGLPKSAINITLDGMNIQDNYLKTSDGYYARLTPTLDSVDEVTVTTAGNTADATGQGGVQIKFVTKSGTNNWVGTAYEYLQHDALNANTWFNNRDLPPDPTTGKAPKTELRDYQQGFAQGGPILKNKAFFFVNYEEERRPAKRTLQRTALTPEAAGGLFSYNVNGTTRGVNLLQLAAANGQLATLDPTVAKALSDVNAATHTTGSLAPLSNPLVQQYTFQTETKNFNPAPTFRVDYDVSQRHRLTGSMNYRHINSTPDSTNNNFPPFPGFPQTSSQQSTRWTTSESLRSTVTSSVVNEFRVGATGGATLFGPELDPSMFAGTGGLRLNLFGACCGTGFQLTNLNTGVTATNGGAAQYQAREASTTVVEDTATWIRGTHSVTFGASMVQADVWLKLHTMVPTANFGLVGTDPANAMFTAANFPGASATDLTNAQNLYAMLTGRLTSLTGDARINPAGDAYVPLGESTAQGRMREFDFYAADSWRTTTNLTVSAGVRYVLQLPFYPTNNSYTTVTDASLYGVSGVGNLFQPGVLTGNRPNYIQNPAGTYAYNTDKNNVAPSVGLAWQAPGQTNALGRLIFGSQEGDSVLRGGFALAFQRPGMSDFTGVFNQNQGIAVTLQRDTTNAAVPILLRSQPALPTSPSATYPISTTSLTNTVNAFDANLQLPYTQSYTVGWQRKLGRDTAIELRYVGSRHRQDWETVNLNEISITDNGFLGEFRKAQANLQANMAAGRGATFAYTGAPGTSPLPIFLAYFNGVAGGQAGDATKYNGANWTSPSFVGFLAAQNPNPFGFMCNNAAGCTSTTLTNGLIGNTTYRGNAAAAGLPANFFLANPDVLGGANLTTNFGGTRANALQFEFRKRMSNGLQLNASYAWGQAWISQRYGFTRPAEEVLQVGQVGGVQHAFKANWLYELPFGRDQRWGSGAGSLKDGLIGGWSVDGVARIQTGEMLDFGNVRLVGMSADEFRKAIDLRVASNGQLFILPDDIIQNTVRAFNVSATSPTGYGALGVPTGRYLAPANGPDCIETAPSFGDCGVRSLVVNGPPLVRFDIAAVKRVRVRGSTTFEFRAEMLNAFNKPYFNPATNAGIPLGMTTNYTASGGLVVGGPIASSGTPINNAFAGSSPDSFRLTSLLGDNTSRIIQLVFRVRW
jgi:carboxypeptidase family protein/TonB-dependent receptor-like protein